MILPKWKFGTLKTTKVEILWNSEDYQSGNSEQGYHQSTILVLSQWKFGTVKTTKVEIWICEDYQSGNSEL